jgi:large subunit ribosomal protein L34
MPRGGRGCARREIDEAPGVERLARRRPWVVAARRQVAQRLDSVRAAGRSSSWNTLEAALSCPASADDARGGVDVPKRTWQPKKRRRLRVHGFLSRMSDRWGRAVLKARRLKGRRQLTVSDQKFTKG